MRWKTNRNRLQEYTVLSSFYSEPGWKVGDFSAFEIRPARYRTFWHHLVCRTRPVPTAFSQLRSNKAKPNHFKSTPQIPMRADIPSPCNRKTLLTRSKAVQGGCKNKEFV